MLLGSAVVLLAINATWPACAQSPEDVKRSLRYTHIVAAVSKVRSSVVNISTERVVVQRRYGFPFETESDPTEQLFRQFFRGPEVERRKVQIPLGSGCIISRDGLVITNEHVVRRATNIKLSLDTGETLDAVLLAADMTEDLALLRAKIDKPLSAIPVGDSTDLMLGETVIALGNPFGFENSVTSGIVSALNREIEIGAGEARMHYTGLIQASALINPGNSGGPLVNIVGDLVGINTAVVDQAQGIGFAITINHAREVLAPLLAMPQVSEAWLGAQAASTKERKGIRITFIEKNGPAENLLKIDDIITCLNGALIADLFDFYVALVQHKPGDAIGLEGIRGNDPLTATLTLGRLPEPSPQKVLYDKLGISGQNMSVALAKQIGAPIAEGVLVSQMWKNSAAEEAGLQAGDIITQIGPHPVRTLREAAAALASIPGGYRIFVVFVRDDYRAYTRVLIPK